MIQIDLGGAWNANAAGSDDLFPATVPGCIHTDLLAAGRIEDPYYRDNEEAQMWIGETDWVYSREFDPGDELLSQSAITLRCDGLDTLATIELNGRRIGTTDNAFRTYEWDVKDTLKPGKNRIRISFASTIPYITKLQNKKFLNLTGINHHRISGSNYIRKSQCNYGWDWGPMCVTAGIWRSIVLRGFSASRIDEFEVAQKHGRKSVDLAVSGRIERAPKNTEPVTVKAVLRFDGRAVAEASSTVQKKEFELGLTVKNPALWWPNGMGDQNLYELEVMILDAGGLQLDSSKKRIGLRTLELDRHEDTWGESFQFVVNGKPFFSKGANWIPADTFVTRVTREFYEFLIKSAAEANMNMLRVWGGGIYEDDVFYDLCDEYGICVWQDFMFACSAYPAFDPEFMENVRCEAIDNVKRIRHHASLALWCGNNEIEQIGGFIGDNPGEMTWKQYSSLFDKLIPGVVAKHDPGTPYWPSSPHSPHGDRKDVQNPKWGDAHLWQVWHGRKPFEWYRTCEHRFNSEFGFQSFPEPRVVESFTEPKDRNISSYIMDRHQRSNIGNDAILQYMLSWFRLPVSHDMTLWASQVLQGMAIKYAVEHWRRSMPRGMGTLYWQLNDCWPVASWSSIDSEGNWKGLQYMARDFFAPVLVSGVEDVEKGTIEFHVTNDRTSAVRGRLSWRLLSTTGETITTDGRDVTVGAQKSKKTATVSFKDELSKIGNRRALVFFEFTPDDNTTVSRNVTFFARPKHIELENPELSITTRRAANGVEVTVSAKKPALWVWLDAPGSRLQYSDRFFHVLPGEPVTVAVSAPTVVPPAPPKSSTEPPTTKDGFTVHSIYDIG
ncbi:MAG: glycoside hydrolase family 2 protein [Spirochaetaceae bacterium]|nr:MAG: glycoside hydrolase family 2 protein [Spirochaetaceae bacterium]